jgi:hypothetical protein
MAALTATARDKMPSTDFAMPGSRRYPIHDLKHAHLALAFASGKPEEAQVRAAVHKRYPEIGGGGKSEVRKSGMRG